MPQLDKMISVMVRKHADALVIRQGAQPALVMGDKRYAVADVTLTAAQVDHLVREIAPEAERQAIEAGQPTRFTYAAEGFAVDVTAQPGDGAMIRPVQASDAAGAAGAAGAQAAAQQPTAPPAPAPAAAAPAPAGDRPNSSAIDALFKLMVERNASDLHLSCGSRPMLRIDGEMTALADRPVLTPDMLMSCAQAIAPERNWQEFAEDSDSDFAYEIPGLCRFRLNLFRDRKGPGLVARVIPSKILTADELNLPQGIRNLCHLSKGLVLVTGPTGSGKSTTLTALIDLINDERTDHIITIEDPIEFVHENKKCLINQREVHLHTKGFGRALRAALREDPDIVLVGELRDLETVAIAMETAETGHLVFGTLHTTSAVSTVDRLIDQFPTDQQAQIRVMLAESLKAVIAQVLCKKQSGGRVAALEVLLGLPSVANLIREGKTFQIPSIMQTGRKHGMITFTESFLDLVLKEVITPEEAYKKAVDKLSLLSTFKSKGVPTDFISEMA